jgi:mannan endo-1,4-beta-mannosidase
VKRNRFRLVLMSAAAVAAVWPVGQMLSPIVRAATAVTFTIDTSTSRAAISPYIYGTNQDLSGTERWTARRLGGNRLTGYNWENNASNAGSDFQQSSDNFLCTNVGVSSCSTAGSVVTTFHDKSISMGAMSLITLQAAGYVAKDMNGTVQSSEVAPSARWVPVVNAKGSAFAYPPSLADNAVNMDEEVAYLVSRYGTSSTANGVKAYDIDNEPALWPSTHPLLHPAKTGAAELVSRGAALAKAVKAVDPGAQIFGPVEYGFYGFYALQDAPDWPGLKGSYAWYLDYYLDQMKGASTTAGKRLLDVLDVHWYPEATGCGNRIVFGGGAGDTCLQQARMQAPRTLWDPTYLETSWIATSFPTFLPILPRLQSSINQYYPGTKLAVTEFSYGGEGHISGGIATADAIGIFGEQGVYVGTFWQLESTSTYVSAAYKLYRNYDGANGTYGDTTVKAVTSDLTNSSVHASVVGSSNNTLHLVVLNKNLTDSVTGQFNITSNVSYTSGRAWAFGQSSPSIAETTAISGITGNSFSYTIPALTAMHIVLQGSGGATPTATIARPTATVTATPRPTATSAASATATTTAARATATATAAATATATATSNGVAGACSPVDATITSPFSFDGAGPKCWKTNSLGGFINIWNTTKVTINGVDITNVYTACASYPAKLSDGFWYISYSSASFGHFETSGTPCAGGATATATATSARATATFTSTATATGTATATARATTRPSPHPSRSTVRGRSAGSRRAWVPSSTTGTSPQAA